MGGRWTASSPTGLRVAQEVLRHGPLSRAELARRFGLTPGTITKLTKPLLADGLLVDGVPGTSGGGAQVGRPSAPLDVAPSDETFAGLKVTGDHVYGVVTDIRANVVRAADAPLPGRRPDQVADAVTALVTTLAEGTDPTGIGVALGGSVSNGVVQRAGFLDWHDVDLGALLHARLGRPVVVENDVLAVTEATHWFGESRGLDRFALVTVGAGVGLGLVVHGELVADDDVGLGLVGHLPLDPLGPVCYAGHRGCANAIITIKAITSAVSLAVGRPVDYDEVLDLALAGDPAARRVVDDAGRALGRFVALVANIALPRLVVVGGEGARLATVAQAQVRETLDAHRKPGARPVEVVVQSGSLGEWARGAAVVAIQDHVGAR